MKKNPIFPVITVGKPVKEDYFLGKASERLMLPALKKISSEITDINMPAEGIFHNFIIVAIKKKYPGQAKKVMHTIWGTGLLALTKIIIVVDDKSTDNTLKIYVDGKLTNSGVSRTQGTFG